MGARMRKLMLVVVVVLGAAFAVVRVGLSSTHAAPVWVSISAPADYYGVNAQLAFAAGSQRRWRAAAAQIARLGVGTVRRDAFWSAIEPSPPLDGRHRYRWRATDRLVAALAASGLRWYPIVDYGTPWASGGGWKAPPVGGHVADYGALAGALARRYGPGGRFWRTHPRLRSVPVQNYEIWNEPNVRRFWLGRSDAASRLGAMYIAARERIRAVDPSARVVLGGLSAIHVGAFMRALVRDHPGLVGQLDAVALHPYGGGPDGGLQVTYERIRLLRTVLDRLFPAAEVPIEITETGWAVPPVPESWRARRLRQLALELPRSDCDVTRFIVHTWTSPDAGASPEGWFGIARPDGTPRPSGRALRAGIAALRRPVRARQVRICH
jgi:hypothetical protein